MSRFIIKTIALFLLGVLWCDKLFGFLPHHPTKNSIPILPFHINVCAGNYFGKMPGAFALATMLSPAGKITHQVTAAAFPEVTALTAAALEKVVLLNAGGTIDMQGQRGRRAGNGVLGLVRKNDAVHYFDVFDRAPDSSNLGPADWKIIISAVAYWNNKKASSLPLENTPKGIVITHGSDTLAETAATLSYEFTGKLVAPLVLTASHSPQNSDPRSDAAENLKNALCLASTPNVPARVYVVIGNQILLGSRIEKVYTTPPESASARYSYIQDLGGRPIGEFDKTGAVKLFSPDSLLSVPPHPAVNKTPSEDFGYVELIPVNKRMPARVLEDALKRISEIKEKDAANAICRRYGLILEGQLRNSQEMRDLLKQARQESIPVFVAATKHWQKHFFQERPFLIRAAALRYAHARTKLSWLLRAGVPYEELETAMHRDIAGEIFRWTSTADKTQALPAHAYARPFIENNFLQGREVIRVFPGIDAAVYRDAILRLKQSPSQKKTLHLYAYGDGNLPLGTASIFERLSPMLASLFLPAVPDSVNFHGRTLFEIQAHLEALIASRFEKNTSGSLPYLDRVALAPDVVKALLKTVGQQNVPSRKDPELINALYDQLHYAYITGSFARRPAALFAAMTSAKNLRELNEQIKNMPLFLSRRGRFLFSPDLSRRLANSLIKQALMQSHPVLRLLGDAIDEGISVIIHTSVPRGQVDLTTYEPGNMLLAIGARAAVLSSRPPNSFAFSRHHSVHGLVQLSCLTYRSA